MTASPIWGGYVDYAAAPYTAVSATFAVPSLSGHAGALASIWVGLGNVYQVGIYCAYDATKAGNNACRPWTFFLPGGEQWSAAHYPVSAGDVLTLSLSVTGEYWNITITNATQSWTYTEVKSVQAANIGLASPVFPLTQAEVIVEKESPDDLPDFGTITFTDITTTPPMANPQPLSIVNTATDATPGLLTAGSFTITWNGYA